MEEGESRGDCFRAGSIAGAVIGTLLTTLLLVGVAAIFYKQWRRHKGKHLVLVTDPETVEDAYAFDNPCFRDATPASAPRILHKPSTPTSAEKESKWAWTNLGIGSLTRGERKSLDDSCLGPKATKVSMVSLRSHDFTGLGFNICGNMREGIFVKDLLHRGPASESGKIHAGDRITSVRISFRAMVYEDALTILSYASPYDVELELETSHSKPSTLLKKTVSPSAGRLCHPLYRSQSILDLNESTASKGHRLYIDGPESMSIPKRKSNPPDKGPKLYIDNNDTASTLKSVKKNLMKVGIKVLPSPENGAHIENQNEHNRNLERSSKVECLNEERKTQTGQVEDSQKVEIPLVGESPGQPVNSETLQTVDRENFQFVENATTIAASTGESSTSRYGTTAVLRQKSPMHEENLEPFNSLSSQSSMKREEIDHVSRAYPKSLDESVISGFRDDDAIVPGFSNEEANSTRTGQTSVPTFIPSEVPKEVHNAAMAARKNRKSCSELLGNHKNSSREETIRTPPRNKRKAPPPPVNQSVASNTSLPPQTPISNSSPMPSLVFTVSSPMNQVTSTPVSSSSLESLKSDVDKYSSLGISARDDGHDSFDGLRCNTDKITDSLRGYKGNLTSQFKEDDRSDSDGESDKFDRLTRIEVNPEDITVHRTIELDEMEIDRKAASLDDLSTFVQTSRLLRAQSLEMSPCARKRKAPPPPSDSQSPARLRKAAEWGNLQDALLNMQENLGHESTSREDSLDRRVLKRSRSENLNNEEETSSMSLRATAPSSLSFDDYNEDIALNAENNQNWSKSNDLDKVEPTEACIVIAASQLGSTPSSTDKSLSGLTSPGMIRALKGLKGVQYDDDEEVSTQSTRNNAATVNSEVTLKGPSVTKSKEKNASEAVIPLGSPLQKLKSSQALNSLESSSEDGTIPPNFDPEEDNALAMIVNDGVVIKSPTAEEVELDFRRSTPLPDDDSQDYPKLDDEEKQGEEVSNFDRSLKYFQDKSSILDSANVNSSSRTDTKDNGDAGETKVMSNGKPASGRKPPVPPRRVDGARVRTERVALEPTSGTNGRSE